MKSTFFSIIDSEKNKFLVTEKLKNVLNDTERLLRLLS